MRKLLICLVLLGLLAHPAAAMELQPPDAPDRVEAMVEKEADSFAEGLFNVLRETAVWIEPAIGEAAAVCLKVFIAVFICGLLNALSTMPVNSLRLVCTVAVATALIAPSASLISLGAATAEELSEYGKLLLPVMTAGLAAQGGVTASSALYAGTALFNTLLSSAVSKIMVPMIYLFIALSIGHGAVNEPILEQLKKLLSWAMTWVMKLVLYAFTGYMAITGVVSGTADASALKVAKMAISTSVPVIGGILSDASEAVLVSAGVLKNAAGIYGILTVIALLCGPFLRIGIQYLMIKATAAMCGSIWEKQTSELIGDFATAMGLLLSIVSTQSIMLLISTVCFMKGVG